MKNKFGFLILPLLLVFFLSGCDSQEGITTFPTDIGDATIATEEQIDTDIGDATIATEEQIDTVISQDFTNLILADDMNYQAFRSMLGDKHLDDQFNRTLDLMNWELLEDRIFYFLNDDDDSESNYSLHINEASGDFPFDSLTDFNNYIITLHDIFSDFDLSELNGDYSLNISAEIFKGEKSLYDLSIEVEFNISDLVGDNFFLPVNNSASFTLNKFEISLIVDKADTAKFTKLILSINKTNIINIFDLLRKSDNTIGRPNPTYIGEQILQNEKKLLIWGNGEPFDFTLIAHNSEEQLISYSFKYSDFSSCQLAEFFNFGNSIFSQ
jgi:hypothetical protein